MPGSVTRGDSGTSLKLGSDMATFSCRPFTGALFPAAPETKSPISGSHTIAAHLSRKLPCCLHCILVQSSLPERGSAARVADRFRVKALVPRGALEPHRARGVNTMGRVRRIVPRGPDRCEGESTWGAAGTRGPGSFTRVPRPTASARSLGFVEAPGVEPSTASCSVTNGHADLRDKTRG
jgi:hypothetical protein